MRCDRRLFLKGGLAAGVSLAAGPAAAAWRERARLPYRVQEVYPALWRGRIYVAGGLSPDVAPENENISARVVVYDPDTDDWSEGPALPRPRHHACLVSVEGVLYAFGGFVAAGGGRWSASRDVLRLGGDAGWTSVAEMPGAQCETVAAVHGGRIHLASGRAPAGKANADWADHRDIAEHRVFDPAEGRWTPSAPVPTARNSAAGAILDGRWHLVGGRTVDGGNLATHEVFDFDSGRWQAARPMPQAQGGLAAAALAGRIYVFGGEYFDDGGGVYREVWEYDPADDRWREAGTMPVPRHGLGAVTVGPDIYVIAGAAAPGGRDTTDRLSAFRP